MRYISQAYTKFKADFEAAKARYGVIDKEVETNDILLPIIQAFPPPIYKGKEVKIKFVTQLPTKSPAIAFFCNTPQNVKLAYQRFLENKIREHFNFCGVPLRLYFRQK